MRFSHRTNFAPHELCDAVVVCPARAVWRWGENSVLPLPSILAWRRLPGTGMDETKAKTKVKGSTSSGHGKTGRVVAAGEADRAAGKDDRSACGHKR